MKQLLIPVSMILLAVALRLMPHPANMAPIAALALFGGVYLEKKYALIIPLVAMFLSDLFLGFHASILSVYGCFLVSGMIGMWVKNHKNVPTVIGASVFSSMLFFLVTNFNFWYADALYVKTLEGLLSSYINALPFFRNTLVGDLMYTGIFFGGYEVIRSITGANSKNEELSAREHILNS